jgi:hypothetical protein
MHNIQTKNTETIKNTVSPKQNPKKMNPITTFTVFSCVSRESRSAYYNVRGLSNVSFRCLCGGTARSVIMTVDTRAGIELVCGTNKVTDIIV